MYNFISEREFTFKEAMKSTKKILVVLLYGVLLWLIPFIIAGTFYSREGQLLIERFLFKSIMIVSLSITQSILLILYFKEIIENYFREGLMIGLIWLALSCILDFIILIPMIKMDIDITTYFNQVGLRYLVIPIFSITVGFLMDRQKVKR